MLGTTLAAFGAFLLLGLAACGDGGDDDAPGGSGDSSSATTAEGLVPDLSSSGFSAAQSSKVPGSTQNQDTWLAIYNQAGGGKVASVRIEINLQPNEDAATNQYNALSEALRNPPPDLFGPNTVQQDNAAVVQGDQSKSYRTTKPDGQGNVVFSDIHRFGRAVAIIYAIGPAGADTEAIRKQVAEQIKAKAPN